MVTSLFPEKFRTIDKRRSRFLFKICCTIAAVFALICCATVYSKSRKVLIKQQTVQTLQNIVANVLENYKDKTNYEDLSVDFLYKNNIVSSKNFTKHKNILKSSSGYFLDIRPSDYPKKIKSFLLEYQNLPLDVCVALLTADWEKNYSQNMRTVIVGNEIYTWPYMQNTLKIKNALPLSPEQANTQCDMIIGEYPGYIVLEYF